MKYILVTLTALIVFMQSFTTAHCEEKLKSYKYLASNIADNEESYNSSDMYSQDLNRIEIYLYRKIYPKQSLSNRIERIERTIFKQTYPTISYSERMNNILSCYQDTYNMKNYVTNYYSPNPLNRMWNAFNGYPTGFTPPIAPTILNTARYPGYNNMYYSNRGYRYNNVMQPTVGAGVRILD